MNSWSPYISNLNLDNEANRRAKMWRLKLRRDWTGDRISQKDEKIRVPRKVPRQTELKLVLLSRYFALLKLMR